MSQFRLARISLLLAAIGLQAVPALITSVHAQDKAAAPAAKQDQMSEAVFKVADPKKVQEMLTAKNFAGVQAAISAGEAVPTRTPYDSYVLTRMKVALASATKNDAMLTESLEAAIASSYLSKAELSEFVYTLANNYYVAKNYPKAIELYKRYQQESSTPEKATLSLNRAYYLSGDLASAKASLDKSIGAAEAAGKAPTEDDLRLISGVYDKSKDKEGYLRTLEKLVQYYPNPDLWADILQRLNNRKGFDDRLLRLDYYRLMALTTKNLDPEQYVEYVEQAMLSTSYAEAKKVADKGYETGALGQGGDAAKHKVMRDKAAKAAAEDAATIGNGEAGAAKAKTGQPLVNLGFTYVTMNQYDKGIELMQKGIAKGGLKGPKEVELRLGIAYVMAGRKDEALKVFESLKSTPDIVGDLARYWIMYVNGPKGTPAVKAG